MAVARLGQCSIGRITFAIRTPFFRRLSSAPPKNSSPTLTRELPNLKVPTWKDETLFEYHRGVMTTQANTKQRIRRDEELMLDAEKYAALASLFGRSYPQISSNLPGRICYSTISTMSCRVLELR